MPTKKTQTDKPRRYHAEFRLTTSWSRRDENPDKRRYHANYESKFKPGTDEHTIDFWEEVLNCFGPLKTPYEEKIRLYRKSDGETAPLNPYDDVTLDSCEAAFDEQEKIQRLHDAEKAAEKATEEAAKEAAKETDEKVEEKIEEEPAEKEQVEADDSGNSDGGPLPDENGGEKDETDDEPADDTVDAEDGTVSDGEKTDDVTDSDCDDDSVSDIDSDDEPSDAADGDTETTKDDTAENDE